jgi:hypothetical protein
MAGIMLPQDASRMLLLQALNDKSINNYKNKKSMMA